ncbi:DNA/RNA nuclease SfsA [Hahella sp. KA22]|uniref:DNA/RNA nuclease SfsA n=1 Tax=Hahella sp. KA22 TaxID=1628392 RepID=UPI000FDD536F|nr:DNA/RNA nuclease SfsA [Hahella sp. KA22]AZZ94651.1 DNA/RNA nuclease SfsA [Hahella sp. KA22]QAY58024.1 DNA/RNA nuclease SfsA [Hahella sp. KA22]
MKIDTVSTPGRLLKRYKRFLADIQLHDGGELTIHCPNTGAMTGCAEPGSLVYYSDSGNPARKYRHTWELVETPEGEFACVNTARPNQLVGEAIDAGVIKELQGYPLKKAEVKFGDQNSRADWMLSGSSELPDCYVEVKNVTLCLNGRGYFPDAVSTRGQKHLEELMSVVRNGKRAALVFCVNHSGITVVSPASHIDARYGILLTEAIEAGVEVLAYKSEITPGEIRLSRKLEVIPFDPEAF